MCQPAIPTDVPLLAPPCCPRSGWFEFLEQMRRAVGLVVILTCPTERYGVRDRSEARQVIAERNDLLRQLAAASIHAAANATAPGGGRPFVLLDVDAMTRGLPKDVVLSPLDYHYSCYPGTVSKFQSACAWLSLLCHACMLPHCPVYALCSRASVCACAAAACAAGAYGGACLTFFALEQHVMYSIHARQSSDAPVAPAALQTARCCGRAATAGRRRSTANAASKASTSRSTAGAPTQWDGRPGSCSSTFLAAVEACNKRPPQKLISIAPLRAAGGTQPQRSAGMARGSFPSASCIFRILSTCLLGQRCGRQRSCALQQQQRFS